MAQKTKPQASKTPKQAEPIAHTSLAETPIWMKPNFQMAFLVSIAVLLYINSIFSGYVLDDMMVITNNAFTKKGFQGIKDLLCNDSFLGFSGMDNQLAGGRYRPLSIVSFAIEYGLFGQAPYISHFINVLLYGGLVAVLYQFLTKHIFNNNHLLAFIATLLFTIHPIHTEVVANIKSRDELMCLLFVLLATDQLYQYLADKKKITALLLSCFCFLLSLLSKENSVIFIVLVPMISWFFKRESLQQSITSGLPFLGAFFIYFVIRLKITGFKIVENQEILNSPYLLASKAQAFATKVAIMNTYLINIIWPSRMSYDYSYNQIPYQSLSSLSFWASIIVNGSLIIYALLGIGKRHVASFCILFYYMAMSLVTNFVFEVGTPMADRFLFQPSLALAILITYYLGQWMQAEANKSKTTIVLGALLVLTCVTGAATIARNIDWQSEYNLYLADVKTCPNSSKTHNNAGVVLINASEELKNDTITKRKMLMEALDHVNIAIGIHPKYVDAWLNKGVVYSRLEDMGNTEKAWMEAKRLSPNHPKLVEYMKVIGNMFFNKGLKYSQSKRFAEAIPMYEKSLSYGCATPIEAEYNMGGCFLMSGNKEKAKEIWTNVLTKAPDHADTKKWLQIISQPLPNKQ